MRTIFPSRVAGSPGPVWLRIPSRTSTVRLSPAPVLLEDVDQAQRLLVVAEMASESLLEDGVERLLTRVPERRVPEVVPEGDRLGQVLVQPERAGDDARDPRRLERVCEPRAEVIPARGHEHLRLVLEPAERLRVDDAIAVALEGRPQPTLVLRYRPPTRLVGANRERRQRLLLEAPDAGLEALGYRSGKLGHVTQA